MWHSKVGFLPGPAQRSGGVCDIFPATPSCSQNSCWGLLWQLSTESTGIHLFRRDTSIPVQSLSFFLFLQFLATLSFKQPKLGFFFCWVWKRKWWKTLLFWITVGRCNYSVLWNLHRISGNRAAERSCYIQTDMTKTAFDLASSVTILFHVTFDSFNKSEVMPLDKSGIRWTQEKAKQNPRVFFLVHAIVQYLMWYAGV